MSALSDFDPNSPISASDGIFGLPCTLTQAKVCLIPAPFDATTSFITGTAKAPAAIKKASEQIDLYHEVNHDAWRAGIYMLPETDEILSWNEQAKSHVAEVRQYGHAEHAKVNEITKWVNDYIHAQALELLYQDKTVGLIGGDHASAYGNITAHLQRYPNMGILQVDAHDDLREAYEGFHDSHASVMHNVMKQTDLKKLVSVAVRDYCEQEVELANELIKDERMARFTCNSLAHRKFQGEPWGSICNLIVSQLPQEVYVSFDIDGLDPSCCSATGTPVPGGLSYLEAIYLLRSIIRSGKRIIGFDLVEVGSAAFDANVGARLVYELAVLSMLI